MQQKVQNKPLSVLMGLLVVAGVLALMAALAFICSVVQYYVNPTLGSILFWCGGAGVAYYLMREVVMSYLYTYNGMVLRIERMYGKRPRFIEDISVRHLNGIGTLAEMKAKFPSAAVVRATRKRCALAELAVAYTNAEGQRIAVIQPDEDIRAKLYQNLKKS